MSDQVNLEAARARTRRAPSKKAMSAAADSPAGTHQGRKAGAPIGRRHAIPLAVVAASLFSFDTARAQVNRSCEQEIARAAVRYDIPLAVFYAVGLNETGSKGRLQVYAMNIDGKPATARSLPEALQRFRAAKATGAKMIDIGCMQINHHYHGARFPTLQAMFDPTLNIDYAARFLRELKQREKTWTMAVARYNAGPDNNPAQKRYVCGVLTKMVASGFGAWTDAARTFCFGERVAKSSN